MDAYPGGGRLARRREALEREFTMHRAEALSAWGKLRGTVADLR
jgi:hypothetical protein